MLENLVFFVLCLLPFIFMTFWMYYKRIPVHSPLLLVWINWGLFPLLSGVGVILMVIHSSHQSNLPDLVFFSQIDYFVMAFLIMTVSIFFIFLGYHVGQGTLGQSAIKSTFHINRQRGLILAFFLIGIGLIGFIEFSTYFGGLTDIETISKKRFLSEDINAGPFFVVSKHLIDLLPFGFFLYICTVAKNISRMEVIVLLCLFIIVIIPPIYRSQRIDVVMLFLGVLFFFKIQRPGRSVAHYWWILALGTAAFLVLTLARKGSEITFFDLVTQLILGVSSRDGSGFLTLASIIQSVEGGTELLRGKSYLSWLQPVISVDGLPPISLGQELKVTLLDRVNVRGGGIPPSGLGELYLNFGAYSLILVPIVSIAVGFCFAAFYRGLDRSNWTMFVYIISWINILPVFLIKQFSQNFLIALKTVTLLFLIRFVACSRRD